MLLYIVYVVRVSFMVFVNAVCQMKAVGVKGMLWMGSYPN